MAFMKKKSQVDKDELDFITSAKDAVGEEQSGMGSVLIWMLFIFAIAAVVWMSQSSVEEIIRGEGRVVTSQNVQMIQNLEGGIIKELLVAEGDIVEKGQLLAKLDDTRYISTANENQKTLESLTLKIARLSAEATGKRFVLTEELKTYSSALVTSERDLHISRRKNLYQKKQVLKLRLDQKHQELSAADAELRRLREEARLLSKELRIKRPLLARGLVTEIELLQLERQQSELDGRYEQKQLSMPKVRAEISEVKAELEGLNTKFREEANQELSKVIAEKEKLEQTSLAISDRVDRTVVMAPAAGVVQKINVSTQGGVLKAGDVLMEIVPLDDHLLIETKILPKDIAFIHPEQNAVVKITAYDFSIYGGLSGVVKKISADTFEDEKGNAYYLLKVEAEQNYLGDKNDPKPITTGMVADVGIITGEKSLLTYILKPVVKTLDVALTER